MKLVSCVLAVTWIISSASAAAGPDMLPLKHGIFVPVRRPCQGAFDADIVNYWGGRSAIGVSRATCSIKAGNVYTLRDECKDVQSGEMIEGGPTVLTISSPISFRMSGIAYRCCGPKVQF